MSKKPKNYNRQRVEWGLSKIHKVAAHLDQSCPVHCSIFRASLVLFKKSAFVTYKAKSALLKKNKCLLVLFERCFYKKKCQKRKHFYEKLKNFASVFSSF